MDIDNQNNDTPLMPALSQQMDIDNQHNNSDTPLMPTLSQQMDINNQHDTDTQSTSTQTRDLTSQERIEQRRKADRIRKRLRRQNETSQERNQRLEDLRQRSELRRSQETLEERDQRLENLRQRRSQETIEERSRRLEDTSQRNRLRLSQETSENREQRLDDLRQRAAIRREEETEQERNDRLNILRDNRIRRQTNIQTHNNARREVISARRKDSYLGKMDKICQHCGVLRFKDENKNKCCSGGKRVLPEDELPEDLIQLLTKSDPQSKEFRNNIIRYKNLFAMTSCGAKPIRDIITD